MSRSFGEEFTQPIDFYTGKPISGAPLTGAPETTRPKGNGIIRIMPETKEGKPNMIGSKGR